MKKLIALLPFIFAVALCAGEINYAKFDVSYQNLNKDLYNTIKKLDGGQEFLEAAGYKKVVKSEAEIIAAKAAIQERAASEEKAYSGIVEVAKTLKKDAAKTYKKSLPLFQKQRKELAKMRKQELKELEEGTYISGVISKGCVAAKSPYHAYTVAVDCTVASFAGDKGDTVYLVQPMISNMKLYSVSPTQVELIDSPKVLSYKHVEGDVLFLQLKK